MLGDWLVVSTILIWLINYSYNMVNHYRSIILVGGFNSSEKYEFVNGKDDIPYIMEKCLKPPARGFIDN